MIIDTNVIVSVDDPNPVAREHCVVRCREVLREAKSSVVGLDSNDEILMEYLRNVSQGYPLGVGASFARYVYDNRFDETLFERVDISADPVRGYREFPEAKELSKFDPADRKFVAVSLASRLDHTIYNATDDGWAKHDQALGRAGVNVLYLCPSVTKP
jgi:hypothetical protein